MAAPTWDVDDLELRVRERVDMVGSSFVSNAEMQRWLESAWQEFYGIICGEKPEVCMSVFSSFTAAGSEDSTLSGQVKKIHGIRYTDGSNQYFLNQISLRELQAYSTLQRGKPQEYVLTGSLPLGLWRLFIRPIPDAIYTLEWFVSQQLSLVDIADTQHAVHFDVEWSEYLVLTAAIKARDKEESDCSVLIAERAAFLDNMRKSWSPMDVSGAGNVVRVMQRARPMVRGMSDDPVYEDDLFA